VRFREPGESDVPSDMLVVYVDGPPHRFPDRAARDRAQQERLESLGYLVVRFEDDSEDGWERIVQRYPSVFGAGARWFESSRPDHFSDL
jgi:Protein of unknown function (DUF559)